MTCFLNSLRNFALVLQGGTGQTTRKDFALLVAEHEQVIRILVVDVLDASFGEAAVLFTLGVDLNRIQIANVVVGHDFRSLTGE
mgnify:CR=1 FL=1